MKLIYLLFLIFACSNALSQNVFPDKSDNPVWTVKTTYYAIGETPNKYVYNYDYYYGETVTICGFEYIEIIEKKQNSEEIKTVGYVREDSRKIFIRSDIDCNIGESLIYDFTLDENSIVDCGYEINESPEKKVKFKVLNKDKILVSSQEFDYYDMEYQYTPESNEYNGKMKWIEKVGSTKHPFYPLSCIADYCDMETILIELKLGEDIIFTEATNIENDERSIIRAFYNSEQRSINVSNVENQSILKVYNIEGRLVFESDSMSGQLIIDASKWDSGIYFIRSTSLKNTLSTKIIVF